VTMPSDGAGTLSRQQVADILAYKRVRLFCI